MKRYRIQGLSLALVDGQKVVWAEGFGYADAANRIPAAPETIYPAGSIAKLFTATAALRLVDRGDLDIDLPVQAYLPEFTIRTRFPGSRPITPRCLMTHHSGIPSDHLRALISQDSIPLDKVTTVLREEWTAYPPNFIFSYSNLAFELLGALIENMTGEDFATHTERALFQPMRMMDTSFIVKPDMKSRLSKGYKGGEESTEILLRSLPSPAAPIYTSAVDLGRFIKMIFGEGKAGGREILRSETLEEAFRRQNGRVPLDFDLQMGLGWFLNDLAIPGGGRVASHGGTLTLFHSQLAVLPDHKLGVAVVSNSSGSVHAVNRIAEETLKSALEEKTGFKQPVPGKMDRAPVVPWPKEDLDKIAGHYATGLRVFTVHSKGNKLYTRLMGRNVELVNHPGGQFSLRYRLLGLIPVKLGSLEEVTFSLASLHNRKALVLHRGEKRHLLGEKIESSPVPESWLRRLGEYELVDPLSVHPVIEKAELKYDKSFLMLDVRLPALGDYGIERLNFAIRPLSDHEAILLGLGRNMGETIRVVMDNGSERLRYSGCEFIKKPD